MFCYHFFGMVAYFLERYIIRFENAAKTQTFFRQQEPIPVVCNGISKARYNRRAMPCNIRDQRC